MKRLISMLLSVIMVISLLPFSMLTVSASTFAGGDGSPQNPYQISTAQQLNEVRNDLNANYILINDITLSSNWHTIEGCFSGTFDGNNRTIHNLSFQENEADFVGFFSECKGNIFDLNFSNVSAKISGSKEDRSELYCGVITSKQTSGTIKNCDISGTLTIDIPSYYGKAHIGGISGRSLDETIISDCSFNGDINIKSQQYTVTVRYGGISGESYGIVKSCSAKLNSICKIELNKLNHNSNLYFGGILGVKSGKSSNLVEDCYANVDISATVSGTADMGGILGSGAGVSKCEASGNLYCDANGMCKIGGIAGSSSQVLDSYANCIIVCDKNNDTGECYSKLVGGLVGESRYATICNSASNADITVFSHSDNAGVGVVYLGGLVGQSTECTISNCYSKGNFYGESTSGTDSSSRHFGDVNIGGLIGSFYNGNNTLINCYFSGKTDGDADDKENIGAIFGEHFLGEYDIENCYYNSDLITTSGQKEYAKSSNSLKTESTFTNWDFNKDWIIKSNFNEGYPTLRAFFEGLFIEGVNTVQNNKETILKAIRYDENGNVAPEGGIVWSCSDERVAQISPWGNNVTVKGLKGGKATITATHAESGQKADFEIEVVSYVMTLAGGYTVMLDEELEINYAVKQGEEYVHNDLDIKWEIESKDSNNAVKIISDKDNAYTRALTIKGINEGECDLVAKVDGAELGRTKIEVLGNLADTINDETIIRAKYLVNNSQYKYYKNYNSVHGMFADEMDLTPSIVKYSLDNYLSVFYKSIYKGKAPDEVTATEFYECVLVKLLNDDENVKVFGKVGDVMSDYILKYGQKIAEKGTKIDDTNKKQLKEICEGLCGDGLEDVGFIDTLLISGKSIETYFEEYAKIYQMASCTNEQIKAIKLIKNSTSDKALKTACDNVIKSIEKAQADTAKYAVSSGTTKTAEQLSEYSFEKMVGALEKFSPALAAFDLVKEITSPINNILFQADDIESDTIDLYALIVIENALKDAMSSAENTFNSNPTAEKAENLMAVADFYKNVQLYGCDICDSLLENYGEAKRNQGIAWDTLVIIMKNVVNREVKMSDVFNALFGNVDAETLDNRKTLSNIRKLIDSADFYGSEGTDVAEFIREVKSTTPSEWAKPEIKKATDYGFLPDYMQNNYQNNITRAEFCTILTWMIEEKAGKGIDQLIEEKGTPIKSPFEDTYYEYADYMCKLGIVNGVSATEFDPLGEITREQAATMLMRTADVLGYDTSYNTSVESGVSSWATEGVGFVTENGIMNGTGNGFEPQGKYTKEQAIATFVRMYDNLK